jgi:NAD(P)-dependent dehydrogenase (short-subunit alcohol dehydrogenase family)
MGGKKIIFVSGANRGIGLALVRQISEMGHTIIGGYRVPDRSKELLDMAENSDHVSAARVDVTNRDDVRCLYDFINEKSGRLDLLINNAGIHLKYSTPIDEIEPEDILENFRVNVIGPFLTSKVLRPLLAKSDNPKIINISSQMGSIELSHGNATPYRISKAAVNMLTKNQALAYIDDGIITVAMHPGWVRTDMGGPEAPLSPAESVSQMFDVIDGISEKDNGSFLGYDGKTRPY